MPPIFPLSLSYAFVKELSNAKYRTFFMAKKKANFLAFVIINLILSFGIYGGIPHRLIGNIEQ